VCLVRARVDRGHASRHAGGRFRGQFTALCVGDLTHWHHDTFLLEWRHEFPWFDNGWAQFVLDRNGKVVELKLDVPNEDFWFTELEFNKLKQEH